ncbi:Bumetanide-sensitive sodium-(potassium)-chloride cotransporter, partial [Armadillidium vulgare]
MLYFWIQSNWRDCDKQELRGYFNTLHQAFNFNLAVAILRVQNGFDYSHILEDETLPPIKEGQPTAVKEGPPTIVVNIEITPPPEDVLPSITIEDLENVDIENDSPIHNEPTEVEKEEDKKDIEEEEEEERKNHWIIVQELTGLKFSFSNTGFNRFKTNSQRELSMFGGCTTTVVSLSFCLIFLATRSQWSKCKLRVFALANHKNELDVEHRSMVTLLAKFRIDVKDVVIITDLAKKAEQKSCDEFEEMISRFRRKGAEPEKGNFFFLL